MSEGSFSICNIVIVLQYSTVLVFFGRGLCVCVCGANSSAVVMHLGKLTFDLSVLVCCACTMYIVSVFVCLFTLYTLSRQNCVCDYLISHTLWLVKLCYGTPRGVCQWCVCGWVSVEEGEEGREGGREGGGGH